jgi:hypothetical protein
VTRKWIAPGVLAVTLLLAGVALAQGVPSLDWWVIGGGGGGATVGGTFLNGTVGQSVVGHGEGGPAELDSGFWGWAAMEEFVVYLPLVVRDQ